MAGEILHVKNGELLLMNTEFQRCCCQASSCGYCGDEPTPYAIEVTLSGVTECGCAIKLEEQPDVDGTYTLTQHVGDSCKWEFSDSGYAGAKYGTWTSWANPGCVDNPMEVPYASFSITVEKIGSDKLTIEVILNNGDDVVFSNTNITNLDANTCVEKSSISNSIGSGDCFTLLGSSWIGGYGGTASIEEVSY